MNLIKWVTRMFAPPVVADEVNEAEPEMPNPNPYISEGSGGNLYETFMGLMRSAFPLINVNPSIGFRNIQEMVVAAAYMYSDVHNPATDFGILWECARMAEEIFATDTDPDLMYASDELLTFHNSTTPGVPFAVGPEVRAFFDSAFQGDYAAAIRVASTVRDRGPVYMPHYSPSFAQGVASRLFATMLIFNMSGTLGAQIVPDLMNLADAPIRATMEGDDDGDEPTGVAEIG